jgi:hypothetical protein
MGIVLKRRDNAPIVKTIYGGAINILLNKRNVAEAAEFVRTSLRKLATGAVSLGQLTITKSLRANYADPTRIAHKVLADRIAKRDPGNAPASGDRIPYVYIINPGAELQGDRIELPSYVREKGLKPDIPYYIEHQLSNPLAQLFALRVEEIPGYRAPAGGWSTNEDKRAVERERMAAQLLFGETLQKCSGQQNLLAMGFGRPAAFAASDRPAAFAASDRPAAETNRVVTVESVEPKVIKQGILDSYWGDRILISRLEEKQKALKKNQVKKSDGTKPK